MLAGDTNKLDDEFVYIGPRKVPVWPRDQQVSAVDAGIWSTRFTDTETCHPVLIRRILEVEARLRRESPPPTRCLGGQKIRDLQTWNSPEFELINARAKAMFKHALGVRTAVPDACWVNVYRQWESLGAHSHRRSTRGLLYCLDVGDEDPDCPLSGKFAFVDPRLAGCCRIEEGHMTTPLYPEIVNGTLMIFPGTLVHQVSAYSGRRPRITMAWNINETALPGSVRDPVQLGPESGPER